MLVYKCTYDGAANIHVLDCTLSGVVAKAFLEYPCGGDVNKVCPECRCVGAFGTSCLEFASSVAGNRFNPCCEHVFANLIKGSVEAMISAGVC